MALVKSHKSLKGAATRQSVAALMPIKENQHNLRALHELELIRKYKRDKENDEIMRQEREMKKKSRLDQKLREELQKRRVDLGVPVNVKGVKQELKALIYREDEASPQKATRRLQPSAENQVTLVDLAEEEERDQEIIRNFMKRNRRIWKSLFQRYANQAYSTKGKKDFDAMKSKVSQINLAEITKMLRDHNTYPQFINKEEIAALIRQINMHTDSENSSDLAMLDYDQWIYFVPQLAFVCFQRPPLDKSAYPPVESLMTLLDTFERACRESGRSTALYEDPDASPFVDRDVVNALEELVAEDPNYELPEGFRKDIQRVPRYSF